MISLLLLTLLNAAYSFSPSPPHVQLQTSTSLNSHNSDRRNFLSNAATAGCVLLPQSSWAADVDTEDFLKTGMVSMPMGVSGQAGKAKPRTGVVLRDGEEPSRDMKSGNVLAEILVGSSSNPTPVLATFQSPWKLESGGLFDVECRDAKYGDGAFLTVAKGKGKSLSELPKTFFTDALFSSTGRFSFYGVPTDIKVKKSEMDGNYRMIELVFSNLSQSTNAEIPRTALVSATIPEGTDDVVMLVGSATSNRWKRGAEQPVRDTVNSFKATLAPTSGMKVRAKVDPRNESIV